MTVIPELRIPHQPGDAVSLVERQVRLLRERNIEMRHRLSQLMDVARENDRLFDKTRRLVLDLLDATSLEDVVSTVEDSLRHEFQVPYVSLILFSDSSVSVGRSVSSAEAHQAIGGLLSGGKTVCGVLRPHELAFLFGESATRSAPQRWSPEFPGPARRARHRQSRSAALQEFPRHPVPRLRRRGPGPRAAAFLLAAALGPLSAAGGPRCAPTWMPSSNICAASARSPRTPRRLPPRPAEDPRPRRKGRALRLERPRHPQPAHLRRPPAPAGQSSRSLARLLSATRGLYQYLLREGRCRHDPANGLSAPKSPRKLPRTLADE